MYHFICKHKKITYILITPILDTQILDNGDLKCWGQDSLGTLGNGGNDTDTDSVPDLPIDLGEGRTAIAVESGLESACAILDDGSLKCWGSDERGQLGDGGFVDYFDRGANLSAPSTTTSVDLGDGRFAVKVRLGAYHTCAILDNGDVKCWGAGSNGKLGYGHPSVPGNPNQHDVWSAPPNRSIYLGESRIAVDICTGMDHTCAMLDDGSVKCWGRNGQGQLGIGETSNIAVEYAPNRAVEFGVNRTAIAIACGWHHTCAVLDDGSIKCWGSNYHGELGIGQTYSQTENKYVRCVRAHVNRIN